MSLGRLYKCKQVFTSNKGLAGRQGTSDIRSAKHIKWNSQETDDESRSV